MNRACLAEMAGTFSLIFVGTGAIVVDASTGSPGGAGVSLAFGLVVMSMVIALGGVSGAHINPAVTLGLWAAGRFPAGGVLPYLVAQLTGGVAASGLLAWLIADGGALGATVPHMGFIETFTLEATFTFLLMSVILNVDGGTPGGRTLAGIAIGGTVGLCALFGGPLTGASMNPARSLAPGLVSGQLNGVWIYLTAPVAGSLLAVAGCRRFRRNCCTPVFGESC
ncbi:MAG: MIP/aquaporin family protein [Leptospirillia bacterium]